MTQRKESGMSFTVGGKTAPVFYDSVTVRPVASEVKVLEDALVVLDTLFGHEAFNAALAIRVILGKAGPK